MDDNAFIHQFNELLTFSSEKDDVNARVINCRKRFECLFYGLQHSSSPSIQAILNDNPIQSTLLGIAYELEKLENKPELITQLHELPIPALTELLQNDPEFNITYGVMCVLVRLSSHFYYAHLFPKSDALVQFSCYFFQRITSQETPPIAKEIFIKLINVLTNLIHEDRDYLNAFIQNGLLQSLTPFTSQIQVINFFNKYSTICPENELTTIYQVLMPNFQLADELAGETSLLAYTIIAKRNPNLIDISHFTPFIPTYLVLSNPQRAHFTLLFLESLSPEKIASIDVFPLLIEDLKDLQIAARPLLKFYKLWKPRWTQQLTSGFLSLENEVSYSHGGAIAQVLALYFTPDNQLINTALTELFVAYLTDDDTILECIKGLSTLISAFMTVPANQRDPHQIELFQTALETLESANDSFDDDITEYSEQFQNSLRIFLESLRA